LIAAGTARLKQQILTAREDPAAFIEFVMRTPKGGRVTLEPFHREWLDLFRNSRRVQVEAAKSHGKCLAADQRVHLADGSVYTAQRLFHKNGGVHNVLTYSPEIDAYGYERAFFGDNGHKAIIQLHMQSGRIIERTEEEPLLTQHGFRPIGTLLAGDKIAAVKRLPSPALPGKAASLDEARWLGIAAATTTEHCPLCTLNEPTPHIVQAIFRATDAAIAAYISGFWDACRTIGSADGLISIKAACRPFLEGLQTLLLRLGIVSCLHPSPPQMHRLTIFEPMAQHLRNALSSIKPRRPLPPISPKLEQIPLDLKPDVNPAAEANTWFDTILRVYKRGPQQTYSVEVPANPIYICENTVSHNTTNLLGFLLWQIGYNPNIRIKLFTQSEDKARERLNVLAEMISTNKLVKLVFPSLRPNPKGPWHKRSIQVERSITDKEPTVEASGIMGSVEGGRADLVVLDDVCVAQGTPIFTGRGVIAIEHVRPGDRVMTHLGSWGRVGAVHYRSVEALISFRVKGLPDVCRVTTNHPLFLSKRHNRSNDGDIYPPSFYPASELLQDDTALLAYPMNIIPEQHRNGPAEPDDTEAVTYRASEEVIANGVRLRRVTGAKIEYCAAPVYNISLQGETHSYANNLFVSHNCDYRTSLVYPQHREAIKKKIYAELLPMLEEDGRAVSIATPHHQQDAVASLRRNAAWESFIYCVGTNEDIFLPLWPKRWPRESLKRLRIEVGPLEYDRAYRCKAVSQAIAIIKPEHIQFYSADQMPDPWGLICIQAYDLALTQKKHSSYFAAVTVLYDPDRHLIFVADAWRDKLGFTEQAEAIVSYAAKWQPNRVILEETGYQGALRAYLIEIAKEPLPIVAVSPGSKSKEIRLMETVPMFESGRILFNPRLDATANPEVSSRGDLITELVNFAAATDKDLGDAFAYAVRAVKDFRNRDDEGDWSSGDGMVTRLSIIGR